MPKCTLCDSQSFDLLDGLYFCVDCGTQSQDVREEEIQGELLEVMKNDITLNVNKEKTKKKREINYGKPWFTLEGFQILIKKQVEYLIQIGVNAKLKHVVGQMWFRYVQLTTNTFVTDVNDQSQIVEAKRKRDNIKDYVPVDSIYRPVPKSQTADTDALELSSEIAREEFYEDDDPTGGLFDIESDKESVASDERNVVGSITGGNLKTRKSLGYMTLPHTIAFCYLGLLAIQEPVCISDLIRWVRQGHLPYHNVGSYFPTYMKFSQHDVNTFCPVFSPTKRLVVRLAKSLQRLLSLPAFSPQNLSIHIARFATDLQLPALIHRNVQSVANLVRFDTPHVPVYDDVAIVYIILSLKLIYGLDGNTELELEKMAVDIPDNERSLYVPTFSDLIEVITTCQSNFAKRGVPYSTEDFEALQDGRNYGEFCRDKLFGSWQPPTTVNRYSTFFSGQKGLTIEKREEYAKMFGMFLKKDGMNKDLAGLKHPSSFPLLHGKCAWMRDRMGCELSESSVTCPGNSEALQESSDVINNPFQRVKKRGLSMATVTNYYQTGAQKPKGTKHHFPEDQEKELSPLKYQPQLSESRTTDNDLNTNQQLFRTSGVADDLQTPEQQYTDPARSDPRPPTEDDASVPTPDYVSYSLPKCYYNGQISRISGSELWNNSVLPNSLRQLVDICSKIVESESCIIYTYLRELEMNVDNCDSMSDSPTS